MAPDSPDSDNPDPDQSDPEPTEAGEEEDDESVIDEMRGSGVGVEDPNIVGRTEPGIVEEHVQPDQEPKL